MVSPFFYLDRCRYSTKEYPLTYSIQFQNLQNRLSEKSENFQQRFYYQLFFVLLGLLLFTSIFFQTHILFINALFGPYHLNLKEFNQHVEDFKIGQSWFYQIQYIQVEIGNDNIQNPSNKNETIKRFSDARKRDFHVATYKKLKNPQIYIKLPTKITNHFHSKFPFKFSAFSSQTFKCILRTLLTPSTPEVRRQIKFNKKSDIIDYIDKEYSKNATLFNMQILTECGIFTGYLYRPLYEIAFILPKHYPFYPEDIAFDVTRPYLSKYLFYFFVVFYITVFGLLFYSLFNLILYNYTLVRIKYFENYGLLSSPPLIINESMKEELWLLKLPGSINQQLLKLDKLIYSSEHRYSTMSIIEPEKGQQWVVMSKVIFDENEDFEELSLIICPVSDIREIVFAGIRFIDYTNNKNLLRWQTKRDIEDEEQEVEEKRNFAEWLHQTLLEVSGDYRQHYLIFIQGWRLNDNEYAGENNMELVKLINEEKNIQRLKYARLYSLTYQFNLHFSYANCRVIASFRFIESINPNFINAKIPNEQHHECSVCCDELVIYDQISTWPCSSTIPHRFHYICMLKWLRIRNVCPLCQQPAVFNI